MSAYQDARNRPDNPPKGWKGNKGKCRMRMVQFRVRYQGSDYLMFFCAREDHWHGKAHPVVKVFRSEDIIVEPESLYGEMVKP